MAVSDRLETTVTTPIAGTVRALHAQLGEAINGGDLLAIIDPA